MQEVTYVPSRRGTNYDEYRGVIVRQTGEEAGTYRIGEYDYSSSSRKFTYYNGDEAINLNYLVGVVVNTHVQGTEDGVNTWGLSGGKWQRIVNTGKLTPYNRAYLKPSVINNKKMLEAIGASTGNNAKIAMIFDYNDDSEVTGISTITEENPQTITDSWYTINGQRLDGCPTAKGIYIHNGRKEVIR